MTQIMACIDGSQSSPAVCDYGVWASQRLQAPLTFLHVVDQSQYPVTTDLSGNIGLGSREHLLEELVALDAQRSKLALEQGQIMLEAAKQRAIAGGIDNPQIRQRHGSLVETLSELEDDIRLLVIGKQGANSGSLRQHIGTHLESVVRTMRRPILVTPPSPFKTPASAIIAFDGSATTRKGVEVLAASPLLRGLPIHLVMVGAETGDTAAQMEWAQKILESAGFTAHAAVCAGEVEPTLHAYQSEYEIDLLVMGAYGHSRIRQFLVGSTTTSMIRATTKPLLLLR